MLIGAAGAPGGSQVGVQHVVVGVGTCPDPVAARPDAAQEDVVEPAVPVGGGLAGAAGRGTAPRVGILHQRPHRVEFGGVRHRVEVAHDDRPVVAGDHLREDVHLLRPHRLLATLGEMRVEHPELPPAHRGRDRHVSAVLGPAVGILHGDGVRHRRRREDGLAVAARLPRRPSAAAPPVQDGPVLDVVVESVTVPQEGADPLHLARARLLETDDLGCRGGDLRRQVGVPALARVAQVPRHDPVRHGLAAGRPRLRPGGGVTVREPGARHRDPHRDDGAHEQPCALRPHPRLLVRTDPAGTAGRSRSRSVPRTS